MAKKTNDTNKDIGFNLDGNEIRVPSGKSWFLGIGIDQYREFTPLNNAVKDVHDIRDVLVEKYGFEISNTEILCNEEATRENIIEKLIEFTELPSEARLLIYYSGHGYVHGREKAQKGYWIPVDAKKDRLSSYIDNLIIRDWIKDYRVRHLLLISDSCFSESLITREVTKGVDGTYAQWEAEKSRFIFSSGKGVVSDGTPGENSPFASQIIKNLRRQEKVIDIVSLSTAVTIGVKWNYEQKADCSPIFQAGHEGGRFLFIPKSTISPEERDWIIASEENTSDSYHDFMVKYSSKSAYYRTAKSAFEILEEDELWDETKSRHIRSAYFNYLEKYPNGKYKPEAEEALNTLKNRPPTKIISLEPLVAKPEIVNPNPTHVIDMNKTKFPFEPEMIFVEGGKFMMGKDGSAKGHEVTLDNFHIGKYQVTQAQWKAVMGDNPSNFKGDDLPVEKVSWNDVQGFIQKLNDKTGRKYRLPTEAEWEYAARGGIKSKEYEFSGSNNIDEVAWYGQNSGSKTQPVGKKKPNELGIFDMLGNVWEWCSDWYGDYPATPKNNPTGPSTGSNRVDRGGSWLSSAVYCRVSSRYYGAPDGRYVGIGFRLLRTE